MARQAALEQHRLAGAADLGEERVVLHVARAELHHVGHLDHGVEVAHVHQLGDDRHAGLLLRLLQQAEALVAEALERVRRGARLVGAAAQQLRAGVLDRVRGLEQHVARLDGARAGDRHEVLAADLVAVDVDDGPLAVRELGWRRACTASGSARSGRRRARRRARGWPRARGRRSRRPRSRARPRSRGRARRRPPRAARRRRAPRPSPPLSSRSSSALDLSKLRILVSVRRWPVVQAGGSGARRESYLGVPLSSYGSGWPGA